MFFRHTCQITAKLKLSQIKTQTTYLYFLIKFYLDFGTKKGEMRVTNLEQLSMSTIIVTGL